MISPDPNGSPFRWRAGVTQSESWSGRVPPSPRPRRGSITVQRRAPARPATVPGTRDHGYREAWRVGCVLRWWRGGRLRPPGTHPSRSPSNRRRRLAPRALDQADYTLARWRINLALAKPAIAHRHSAIDHWRQPSRTRCDDRTAHARPLGARDPPTHCARRHSTAAHFTVGRAHRSRGRSAVACAARGVGQGARNSRTFQCGRGAPSECIDFKLTVTSGHFRPCGRSANRHVDDRFQNAPATWRRPFERGDFTKQGRSTFLPPLRHPVPGCL